MRALAINYPKTEEDIAKIDRFVMEYDQKQCKKVNRERDAFTLPALDQNKTVLLTSFSVQFRELWQRNVVFLKREPQALMGRFFSAIFFGILMFVLWWQCNGTTPIDVLNMTGCCFIIVVNTFMGAFFGVLTVFQIERPVFLREQANKMYGLVPYFMTKNMLE